ncbi:hypothetical protein ORI20_30750 [Mycobacterium sp. CVI_P3]|uniref:Uncharacterized protein n=1 Tax=Mycobacterium pinniadriaticum TaxID=2994102 RepID=A0ABT3SNH9_9MYCO|nr:hypothetical protein [Mycobacterium pinniadriaticum]MCX2934652.1 hypothetical protein [Mycobacterium pinniadriaticum]MCX2941075.1 hypothetical protein [Mycobacterium pinniadriaticum]
MSQNKIKRKKLYAPEDRNRGNHPGMPRRRYVMSPGHLSPR